MKTIEPRLVFGLALLLVFAVLAVIIALGKIEEHTSFGLQIILGALASMGGMWSQWAFQPPPADKPKDKTSVIDT